MQLFLRLLQDLCGNIPHIYLFFLFFLSFFLFSLYHPPTCSLSRMHLVSLHHNSFPHRADTLIIKKGYLLELLSEAFATIRQCFCQEPGDLVALRTWWKSQTWLGKASYYFRQLLCKTREFFSLREKSYWQDKRESKAKGTVPRKGLMVWIKGMRAFTATGSVMGWAMCRHPFMWVHSLKNLTTQQALEVGTTISQKGKLRHSRTVRGDPHWQRLMTWACTFLWESIGIWKQCQEQKLGPNKFHAPPKAWAVTKEYSWLSHHSGHRGSEPLAPSALHMGRICPCFPVCTCDHICRIHQRSQR